MILTCPNCGKRFNRPKAHIRNKTHSCSIACAVKIKSYKPPTFLHGTCKYCGKDFSRRKNRAGTMEYCCTQCARNGAAPRGEFHPNWKGGITNRPHSVRIAVKRRVEEIGKCERCGETNNLQGHHKITYADCPDKGADPLNIEVICASCHAKEHPSLAPMITLPRFRTGSIITCIECGKERYIAPHKLKTAKFCSHACQLTHLHRSMRSKLRKCFREISPLPS